MSTAGRGIVTGVPTTVTELVEQQSASFEVYPNPSNGLVNWGTSATWQLQDILGTSLAQGTGQSVDLSSYVIGIYFIKFDNGAIAKIIKE